MTIFSQASGGWRQNGGEQKRGASICKCFSLSLLMCQSLVFGCTDSTLREESALPFFDPDPVFSPRQNCSHIVFPSSPFALPLFAVDHWQTLCRRWNPSQERWSPWGSQALHSLLTKWHRPLKVQQTWRPGSKNMPICFLVLHNRSCNN